MSEPVARGPLDGRRDLSGEGVALRIVPFRAKFVLRGEPDAIRGPVQETLGLALPEPGRMSAGEDATILWIGPDEVWLLGEPGGIAPRLSGIHHQLVDVSDYYAEIELSGSHAREVLMKLSTLDLHSRGFSAGRVAGSMFGRTQATLWQARSDDAEGGPVFRLLVRWTMADYLWCVLAEAGREFGLPAQEPLSGETWRLAR